MRVHWIPFLFFLLVGVSLLARANERRPVIMLTGYWPPTNEFLRPFSQNPKQNQNGWIGDNWEGRGYDVQSYFPDYPNGLEQVDQVVGDFRVTKESTTQDFNRLVQQLHPIAILSFGLDVGPWEIEVNAPDLEGKGPVLKNSLPFKEIETAVNSSPEIRSQAREFKARIDFEGNAGHGECGLLSRLGAVYHDQHRDPRDPVWNIAQGFIHVGPTYSHELYAIALSLTLRATIQELDAAVTAAGPRRRSRLLIK